MSKKDHVKIRITAKQTIEYSQIKTVPRAVFDDYEKMCNGNFRDEDFNRKFDLYIDERDVCDAGEMEDLEIELIDESVVEASS